MAKRIIILAMRAKLGHAKFQPSSARVTFSNLELNGRRGDKIVRFSTENWPNFGNGEK